MGLFVPHFLHKKVWVKDDWLALMQFLAYNNVTYGSPKTKEEKRI